MNASLSGKYFLSVDKVMPDADAVVVAAEVAATAGVVAVAGRGEALAAKEAASEEWSAVMIRICIFEN
jgi:hypothetical protein